MANTWQPHQYAEQIRHLEDRHIERIEMLAKEVFDNIVLPVLKRYGVSLDAGRDGYTLYIGDDWPDLDYLATWGWYGDHELEQVGPDVGEWMRVRDAMQYPLFLWDRIELGLFMPSYTHPGNAQTEVQT